LVFSEASEYVKSLVYGGLDGIVTTFAIVAAGVGGNQDLATIMLMGFSGLIADGISMGLGDYFSSLAETDFKFEEVKREKWEMDNNLQGEIQEMVDLFVSKHNMSEADATKIVNAYAKYPDPFLKLMMVEELNINPPDADERSKAWKNGIVTLFSFWGFGSLALWVLFFFPNAEDTITMFIVSGAVVLSALFALGVAKGHITGQNKVMAGGEMILNGTVASLGAFLIALWLETILGLGCV